MTESNYEGFVYKDEGKTQDVIIFSQTDDIQLETDTFYLVHVYKIVTNGTEGKWIMKPDLFFNVSDSNLDENDNSSDNEK